MRVILLGPPGSGKGTQAKLLCKRLGLVHFPTGDILREAVRLGTALGLKARPYMEQGKYVPDSLMNEIVNERFAREDRPTCFLMDGYPRTLAQTISFDQILRQHYLGLDAVILLGVSDEEIVRRVSGRLVCPRDGSLYQIQSKPPKKPGICDVCGGPLVVRDDDLEGTVRHRLEVYHASMPPIIDHYRRQGLLREVCGEGAIQEVHESLMRALPVEKSPC